MASPTNKPKHPLPSLTKLDAEAAVSSLCKLIRFPTVSATSPQTGAYVDCAEYLKSELRSVPCLSNVHVLPESPDHSPVVMACWEGSEPSLPILLLNSHYDVVPAERNDWTVDPFGGVCVSMEGKTRIYGRGTQDMKCVCVQYIQAIRVLSMRENFKPTRSIWLSFVPDEEIGGGGMAALLESEWYKDINKCNGGIALALDEGLASETDSYSVFYGERLPWWVGVTARGNTGHGSRFIEKTAVEQLVDLVNRALEFRSGQRSILHGSHEHSKHNNCSHAVARKKKLGDVTTLNVTTIEAGVKVGDTYAYNCCPPVAKCSLDIRISPHMDPDDMKNMLDVWCKECSAKDDNSTDGAMGLSWSYIKSEGNSSMQHATTSIDDKVNPWYNVFSNVFTELGISIVPEVFPAATDSRFLRALGIRALGFSPMRNSEILLHENDEYILQDVFLEGVSVYVSLLKALSSQGTDLDEQNRKVTEEDSS